MDLEAKRAKEAMKKLPLKDKIANFWFYYKIHTIVGILALALLSWSAVQCSKIVDYDIEIGYYGVYGLAKENVGEFAEYISKYARDVNKNGKVDVGIHQTAGNITTEYIDQAGQGALQKMDMDVSTNGCTAFILDEAFKNVFCMSYKDVVKEVIDLRNCSKAKEILKITEDDSLYWVSLSEYGEFIDGDELSVAYGNTLEIAEKIKND